jgi:hypothetical protein
MAQVYEIANIMKLGGLSEKDVGRIGRRVIPEFIEEGCRAVLQHSDDADKSLFTSTVESVTKFKGGDVIVFTTVNATYTLHKVSE